MFGKFLYDTKWNDVVSVIKTECGCIYVTKISHRYLTEDCRDKYGDTSKMQVYNCNWHYFKSEPLRFLGSMIKYYIRFLIPLKEKGEARK